jgi:hypothetical protein
MEGSRKLGNEVGGFSMSQLQGVIFLQSKVVDLVSNPKPGGPGPSIYVSQ